MAVALALSATSEANAARRQTLFVIARSINANVVSRVEPYRSELRLTAFPQRAAVVRVDAAGGVRAELQIAGRSAALRRIFVQLGDGGGPTVRHIDLFGTDLASGKPLRERLEP